MDKKAQERVAIAKDALAWLQAGALVAQKMRYVYPEHRPTDEDYASGKQLRDIVLGKCEVCAKGALFLAKAVRFDKVLVSQLNQAGDSYGPLSQHFSPKQLYQIESAFEGWNNSYCQDGYAWLVRYPDHKERLTAILRNIIKNDGTFNPEL